MDHPGREHAVEQRLHQGGPEQPLAVGSVEVDAECVLHPLAQPAQGRKLRALCQPGQRLSGVGSQEERNVRRPCQGRASQQAALQEVVEPPPQRVRPRPGGQRPEPSLVSSQVEGLYDRAARVQQPELPEVGCQHQSIDREVLLADLLALHQGVDLVRRSLHLDDTSLRGDGCGPCRSFVTAELCLLEQSEVGDASVARGVVQAEHPRAELAANPVQQRPKGRIVAGLRCSDLERPYTADIIKIHIEERISWHPSQCRTGRCSSLLCSEAALLWVCGI